MYKKIKKSIVWCLVTCMVLTQTYLTGFAASVVSGQNRLSGSDRYKTAVAISQSGWKTSRYAVLARGDDYADALCAGPLAKKYGAPILLTETEELNPDTLAELKRLGVKNIYIVGGYGAVSSNIENALNTAAIKHERIYGIDRYETSTKIAEKLGAVSKIVLATGLDFPDALSVSAVASKLQMPILLTEKDTLPDVVKQYIRGKQISQSYIIGGKAVISGAVESIVPGAVRLGGKDRYETNINVMEHFNKDLNFSSIYVAIGEGPNGNEFADALSGAVLAAKTASPVVLTNKALPGVIENYLKSKLALGAKVIALGGEAAVPKQVIDSIAALVDKIEIKATYDKAGTYGPASGTETIWGNVVISAKDVILQNTVIQGDLLLAESIGDGDVTLKDVTVKGTTIVRGGGPNSVIMYNFNGQTVTVDVPDGSSVRLVAQGSTTVGSVTMNSDGKLEESGLTGTGFTTVEIPAGAEVILSGDFDSVNVEAPGANVSVESGRINTLNITESASNAAINIAGTASVTTLQAGAPAAVTGTGPITNANVNSEGVSIAQTPTTTRVADGVGSATVGGSTVSGGTSTTPPAGGGGGGDSTPTVSVSEISVVNATTVTFKSNAVPTTVTWNGTDVKASMTGTNPYTITVPGITKTANTLVVGAASHYSRTVNYTIPVGTYGNLKVINSDIVSAVSGAAAGDTIIVASGTYDIGTNRIVIKNGINFTGDGIDKTVIKGTVHEDGPTPNRIAQPMLLTTSTTGTTLVKGIHFQWIEDEGVTNNWYSALSLAGDNVTVTECKISTTVPDTKYITLVNIGRSGGSVEGEAGVNAKTINFTNNIVGGTISLTASDSSNKLVANISGNTITPVNMEGIWTYTLTAEDELTIENNTITNVPAGLYAIKLMEKVAEVNNDTNYTSDTISAANNDSAVLLQYKTRFVDGSYAGVDGADNKYKTIQAAISAAVSGDTIIVAAGEYKGHFVINKQVDLKGAQQGVDARNRSGNETLIIGSLKVEAGVSKVTIDGFMVQSFGGDNPFGIGGPYNTALIVNSDEATVKNNIFEGAEGIQGPYTYSGLVSITGNNVTFRENVVNQVIDTASDPNAAYISVNSGGTASITDNMFRAALGIGAGANSNVTVSGSTVENATKEGIWFWPVADTASLTIANNEVSDYDAGNHGNISALKVVSKPLSINDVTDDSLMNKAICDANSGIDTVNLQWIILVSEGESIQAAIDAAAAGNTILVAEGEYEGNLEIDIENLVLKSVVKHAATIKTVSGFNAGNGYGGITVLASGVTIDGFKIEQSVGQAVIHTHNSSGVTIKNNSISGSNDAQPRGIDVGYASAKSDNVTVEGNEFDDLYCGVYVNQGENLTVGDNDFTGMGDGAIVFDGTWGNTGDIGVNENRAVDSGYLLYFFNVVGPVTVENNILNNTELTNYTFYNEAEKKYYPTIQAAIDWSIAVDHESSTTNQMRSIALANDSVYIGYIQTYNNGRDVHRHSTTTFAMLGNRGLSAVQPKGLAVDDRGYVYIGNREGEGSYTAVIQICDSQFNTISTYNASTNEFGGIATYRSGNKYYLYIAREGGGVIHRYDITDLDNISLDASFGTNGEFVVSGGNKLRGITVDADGTIFVADRDNNKLFRISADLSTVTSANIIRAMDVALYGGNAYVTSYNGADSQICVVGKSTLNALQNIEIGILGGNTYSRGSSEGWSGIDIGSDGRIWICDQTYGTNKDRLLVSSQIPTEIQ